MDEDEEASDLPSVNDIWENIRRSHSSMKRQARLEVNREANPLHIDPEFSAVDGFEVPILHGFAFFGAACKRVIQKYSMYKDVKVRFAGTVLPEQILKTEMWKEGNVVNFQTTVVETGKLCIAGAGATLIKGQKAKL